MRTLFEEFKKQLDNEIIERKISDWKQEKEILKEYNGRQLLELLQNIDDQKSKKALIKLDTINKVIIIANSGEPFSKRGLKSLMMAHLSSKDKTFIGNKGLGFRSLLNWAGEIYVKSTGLSLEFSEDNRNKIQSDKKRAILSAPEWIDQNNTREWINNINFSNDYITYISIHYTDKSESAILDQIRSISKELLFFINNIEEIQIDIDGEVQFLKKEQWEVKIKEVSLPKELKEDDESEVEEICQFKAIIPPKGEKFSPFLFSYFPTNIKIDFPALIHATFDLDSSRNTIVDSEKNRFIIKELALFLIEIAESFRADVSNWDIYDFLNISHRNDILEKFDFYKKIDDWKEKAKIYPCIDNTYRDKKSWRFYNNSFSDFMQKYSDVLGNIIKSHDYEEIKEYSRYHENLKSFLQKISLKISDINERIIFIKHIYTLYLKSPIAFKTEEKLDIFVNQDNILKENLLKYSEIFDDLEIPDFIELDYVHPKLARNLTDKYFEGKENFDIERDLFQPIILSGVSIQDKLKALYVIFKNENKFPSPKKEIEGISNKYIREERILKICDEEDIIVDYKLLEIDSLNNVNEFLVWLGAKKFNYTKILEKVIKENNQKQNISKTLNAFMILKNEAPSNLDNDYIRTKESIFVFDREGNIKNIQNLFPYNNLCEKESVIASKEKLGLSNFSDSDVVDLLKWLKIKEFSIRNVALEKIDLLKDKNLSKEKTLQVINFLWKSKKDGSLDFKPDTENIFILGQAVKYSYLRNSLTKKYFNNDELIIDYSEFNLIKFEEADNFFKWLGVNEADDNTIVKKIFNSSVDIYDKLKDLSSIFTKNNNITHPNIDFKMKSKAGCLKNSEELFLNDDISKFCDPNVVVETFPFELDKKFLKWLKLKVPTSDYLVDRYIQLLSVDYIQILSLKDRRDIILLLSKIFEEKYLFEKKINEEIFLIDEQENIKKSTFLYKETDISKRYLSESLINKDLNLKDIFLEWLGVKDPNPLEIIENLLTKNNINLKDIYELWKKEKIGDLNDSILVMLPNKNNHLRPTRDLFLEKETTPFYEDNELICSFEILNLNEFPKKSIEEFLIWLGVNKYIKYIESDEGKKIYALDKIKKLEFDKLVLLLEKENILKNKGALAYLQSCFQDYKYWILKDYGISIINPPVNYENNPKRIEILKTFGIKDDFNEENSLFLLKNLCNIDKNGEYSPQIYNIIYEKKISLSKLSSIFTKSKKYIDVNEIFYLDNSKTPKAIRERYNFIDLPINLNSAIVKSIFKINLLPEFKYKILNFRSISEEEEFNSYFERLKPYFLAFGTLNENINSKKEISEKLQKLRIKLGTFDCLVNNTLIKIDDFEMIQENEYFYIKTNELKDGYSRNENLTISIENILLTIFKENKEFSNIFRYSDFNHLDKKLCEEYGSNILISAKELLNKKEIAYSAEKIESVEYFENDFLEENESKISDDNFFKNYQYKNEYINNFVKETNDISIDKEFIKEESSSRKSNFYSCYQNIPFNNTTINPYDIKNSFKNGYVQKSYPLLSSEISEEQKKEAGRQAEEIVQKRYPHYKQVSSYAENGDDSLGYDFTFIDEDGNENYVEVKNFSSKHFWITENELKVAKKKGKYYHIYLVDSLGIINLGNPFSGNYYL